MTLWGQGKDALSGPKTILKLSPKKKSPWMLN